MLSKNHGKRSTPRDWKKYDEFRRLDEMLVLNIISNVVNALDLPYKVKEKGSSRWRRGDRRGPVPLDKFILELKGRDSVEVAESLKVIVPLPEITGLRELLTLGYIYAYHNDKKDPPDAVRLELRPYSGVTRRFDKRGLTAVLLGALALLGQPLIEAWGALSLGAPLPPGPPPRPLPPFAAIYPPAPPRPMP